MYGRRRLYPARPGRAARRGHERGDDAGVRAGALVDAAWRACVVRPAVRAARVAYAVVGSPTSHRVVLRLAMLSALHVACVAMAVLAYIGFYYAWVPDAAVHKDVHLQFAHGGAAPYAHVLLDGRDADVPVWQTEPSVPLFREGVVYDVALEMRVLLPRGVQDSTCSAYPDAMVRLELAAGDTPLYAASRAVLLVREPRVVRWGARLARTALRPFQREPVAPTQLVRVPLLRGITPWMPAPQGALLATRAALVVDMPRVPVQHAVLRFDAHMTGLIYWMYHHALLSLAAFVLVFATIEFVVAGVLWGALAAYFSWRP
ncbi:hypothetical protein MBRA1_003638 [Malassezia brasiliensis]|uniref:Seipin n=1 Tax=Malassezia brasiliensis TaxID=1821822 RepID=A0AAF0DWV0_9BASI|nr:hypothetical protein MBRA1_003638 [Malassezia brasiliensis]